MQAQLEIFLDGCSHVRKVIRKLIVGMKGGGNRVVWLPPSHIYAEHGLQLPVNEEIQVREWRQPGILTVVAPY